ncbi:ogr/Delta-like zinc finger family protein [Paraburkholderia sediminicola]|uniref:ogr/Delta-like zinc finger family protein n=1 Tax=Paraburkholderia sediminicola TaxID=458836 RepID=UPI0038BC7E7C
MKIDCPCCSSEIDARHTESLSQTMRRMYFVCDDCGYRTPAGIEILFSLSASGRPRDGVTLEVRPSPTLHGAVNARTTIIRANAA